MTTDNGLARAIEFIGGLSLPDGRLLRDSTFKSDPWLLEKVLTPILSKDAEGLPLYKLVYVELSRGHYKTSSCANIAIAEALQQPMTDVYAVAVDLGQARLLHEAIEGQRRRSPRLARALSKRGDAYTAANGSKIKVMSSDAPSAFGIGVDCRRLRVIADELTQWGSPALYHALITTLPKVADSQMIIISNAGVDPGHAWQWGVREAATQHGYLFTAEGTIASWIRPEHLAQIEATVPPPIYDRFHRNIWVEAESAFVEMELWDLCRADIPPLDARTPVVLAIDAAVSGDCFGIVAVSRDPDRPKDCVMVRHVQIWRPEDQPGRRIDLEETMEYVKAFVKEHLVVQIAYDPYQMAMWSQMMERERIAWVDPFSQQAERAEADTALYQLIVTRRLKHDGDPGLREHIGNCAFQVSPKEDTKGRLVKRGKGKIDAAVALSMGAARCLYLYMENAQRR